jgi:hypothetical protein
MYSASLSLRNGLEGGLGFKTATDELVKLASGETLLLSSSLIAADA